MQGCVFPNLRCFEPERAGLIDRRAVDRIARVLVNRQAFAGQHRLVNRGRAFNDDAIDGNLFAGPHDDGIADEHVAEGNVVLAALADDARRLGLQAGQLADRVARLPPGARFEHSTEQDQSNDDARGLKVNRRLRHPLHPGVARNEEFGRNRRGQRIEVGRARADGDQRVHVREAMAERHPRAAIKLPAAIEDHRRRQHELQPFDAGKVQRRNPPVCHRDDQHRQRQQGRHPELAP